MRSFRKGHDFSCAVLSRCEAALAAKGLADGGQLTADLQGGSNSVVESQPSKLLVAGSIPVSRSRF